jgi:hypothetical protein
MNNPRWKVLVLAALLGTAALPPTARAALSDVELQTTTLDLSPRVQLILPNGAVDTSLDETISSTTLRFSTRYDFFDNYFDILFDIKHDFPRFFLGTALGDKVDFEAIYSQSSYFQHVRQIRPYIGKNLTPRLSVATSMAFENTVTASIDRLVTLDQGRNVVNGVGLAYRGLDQSSGTPKGMDVSLDLYGSFLAMGSDYDYIQGEVTAETLLEGFADHSVGALFKTGYPLYTARKPLTSVYFIGGYDMMRGYSYKEFFGESLLYLQLSYNIPLVKAIEISRFNMDLRIVTLDILAEFGKVGGKEDIYLPGNVKSSASLGAGCDLTVYRTVRMKFNAYLGQAVDLRPPVAYFFVTAYTYLGKR